jgi:hypothetical protein
MRASELCCAVLLKFDSAGKIAAAETDFGCTIHVSQNFYLRLSSNNEK